MNSKLIKASLAGVAAIAVASGSTTFASWSDQRVFEDNDGGAGTLTLGLQKAGEESFDVGNLTPGQRYQREVYLLSNNSDSTPNGNLFVTLANLVGEEDGCNGTLEDDDDADCAETAGQNEGEFPDDAKIHIKTKSSTQTTCGVVPVGTSNPTYGGFEHTIFGAYDIVAGAGSKSLRELETAGPLQLERHPALAGPTTDPKIFKPGEGVCVDIVVYLPQSADNGVQGDQADFDMIFDLKQDLSAAPVNAG